ncbi:peroxisomal membrane protein 11C isoform X2 [Rhincodon typus]|uniref:peroxisomal membrane protein 11C isoform X2 n=1 Tax=Rhincodon typus TaxID=259920 RepID=UPI0020308EAC|nr:peroxisomal membrane protein 11C isoform X2 [Rhincodon typus]
MKETMNHLAVYKLFGRFLVEARHPYLLFKTSFCIRGSTNLTSTRIGREFFIPFRVHRNSQEEDMIVRLLFITGNLVDQLYYPCEHLAWAADYKILSINAEKWWTLSNTLWTLSLALGALRSFRVVQLLKKKLKGSQNNVHLRMGEANCVSRQAYQTRMRAEILNIITCLADLTNAIHWMPPGFLWAGKFPEWLVGLMGTVSSVISLYQMSCGSCSTKDP